MLLRKRMKRAELHFQRYHNEPNDPKRNKIYNLHYTLFSTRRDTNVKGDHRIAKITRWKLYQNGSPWKGQYYWGLKLGFTDA